MTLHDLIRNTLRPKIVCICGSTRFLDAERQAYADETMAGNIVLSHSGTRVTSGETGDLLDKLHLRKIDLADEILVLNVDGYVGESAAREIRYAQDTGKRIRWLDSGDIPSWFVDVSPNDTLAELLSCQIAWYREYRVREWSKEFQDGYVAALERALSYLHPLDTDGNIG